MIKKYNCVYIYGLLLHNPIPDDLGINDHQKNDKNVEEIYETINVDNVNDNQKIDIIPHNLNENKMLIKCRQDSDCINDDDDDDNPDDNNDRLMYCDQHYGYCNYFHQLGQLCRYDSQCDNNLICIYGKCQQPKKPGEYGSRCNNTNDCNEGLCCARQHGEHICKYKLKLNQQCFVPLGGLNYSLNELCPCDDGLECRYSNNSNNLMNKLFKISSKRRRKNENIMRCAHVQQQ